MLDEDGKPARWLDRTALDRSESLDQAGQTVRVRVEPEDTLRDALEQMLQSVTGCAACIDPKGRYMGVVRIELLTEFLKELQATERDRQAAAQ
jgi:osmoprotectant transport system ATP-binding protein